MRFPRPTVLVGAKSSVRACATLSLALAACTDGEGATALDVTANQAPVAHLSVPSEIRAREPFVVDASGSHDIDGAIASFVISVDGEPVGEPSPEASIVFDDDGDHEIGLVVTDADGETGRARLRVRVAPALDPIPPTIGELLVRKLDDDTVFDSAAPLPGGATLRLEVSADDAASAVTELSISTSVGTLTSVQLISGATTAASTALLALPDIDTSVMIAVFARDAFGNESEAHFEREVLSSTTDGDDDGVPDVLDPSPNEANGVVVDVFALDTFPRDLLGQQMAEDVVEAVLDGTPVQTFTVPASLLAGASPDGTMSGLALFDDMPALDENWALRIRGRLRAPAGLPMLALAIGADDVGVVLVEGAPVASADDEYATNFFRTETLPSTTDSLFWGSAPVAYEFIVANESGPFAFQVDLTFAGPGGDTVSNEELTLASFLLPE
jgi:hypothetical protein